MRDALPAFALLLIVTGCAGLSYLLVRWRAGK